MKTNAKLSDLIQREFVKILVISKQSTQENIHHQLTDYTEGVLKRSVTVDAKSIDEINLRTSYGWLMKPPET